MKIVILSRAPRAYSTRRLRDACAERGHVVRVLDTLRFSISVKRGRPRLYYRDKKLSRYDAVIPRVGASITFYGTAVVRQFEQMGVFSVASSQAISVSRDKLRALQVLSRHEIGMPETLFVRDRSTLLPAIERLGGPPVVIKVVEGTQGLGVILADSAEMAKTVVERLLGAKRNVLIQRFIPESRGRDIRAFVVGGQVVAAMRRVARGEEFRSNVHLGGRAEPVELEPEYERMAILAAQVLGLQVAGVDMLESKRGPKVIEVNSSPGLQGIEGATRVDVAGAIVRHIEDAYLLPDVDVMQRLTLERGYGVAEFDLTEDDPLIGRTVGELATGELEVSVLQIQRADGLLSNPRASVALQLGDAVLLYGTKSSLKQLVPRDQRGRRARRRRSRPSPEKS